MPEKPAPIIKTSNLWSKELVIMRLMKNVELSQSVHVIRKYG
jgi:hypothetical protein